jgi:hypothetical protein
VSLTISWHFNPCQSFEPNNLNTFAKLKTDITEGDQFKSPFAYDDYQVHKMTSNNISLSEKHPDLAAQADGWDPRNVSAGSGQRLPWLCKFGHQWKASVNNRAKGRGCPICAGKQVLVGFNDFATTHPELAKEAYGWDPTTVRPGSNKSFSWKCGLGHTWLGAVNNRTAGTGCPICAGKQVRVGFNDLATTHPELAKEAHGWDPQTVSKGTQKKYEWICLKGHIYVAAVNSRTGFNQTNCAVCAGKQVLQGTNDLATTNPELAEQAFEWDPRTVVAGSGKKLRWKCAKGHVWSAVIASRSSGRGCSICANKKVLNGFNDLRTTNPTIAIEAKGWDPAAVIAGSHKKFKWCCANGHEYFASPHSRTGHHKTGCPVCSGQRVLLGYNDLTTTHPQIAAEADGWDPTTVNAGSNPKKRWKCPLGHTWTASPINRTKHHSGCGVCDNKQVLVGYNDLATKNPELAEQAFEWDPRSLTQSSTKKRKWKCKFGHIWTSTLADRTRGNGCPTCSVSGFDPNREAWFYLIENDEWHMLQIGITTQPKVRLESHGRLGWRLLELRGPLEGHHIQELETAALRSLKKRKATFANNAAGQVFDGWTEAWTKKSLNVTSIKQILDWVYEDEAKV